MRKKKIRFNMKSWNVVQGVRIAGVVLGIGCCVWFSLPYVFANILNIGNVTGIMLSMLLILYMIFMPRVHRGIARLWEEAQGKGIRKLLKRTFIVCMGCGVVLIASLVVIETACMVSTNMKKPTEHATAVVLGCRVYGERPSRSMVERLQAAYEYLVKNPEAKCVVSGGQGNGEDISEAEAMYRWLVDKGIDGERIYKEDKSTSTDENIRFSKDVIVENGLNPQLAIITSEYHTYRAGIVAEKYGMEYGAVPGTTATWLFPTYYVRELYGILAEWIWG